MRYHHPSFTDRRPGKAPEDQIFLGFTEALLGNQVVLPRRGQLRSHLHHYYKAGLGWP